MLGARPCWYFLPIRKVDSHEFAFYCTLLTSTRTFRASMYDGQLHVCTCNLAIIHVDSHEFTFYYVLTNIQCMYSCIILRLSMYNGHANTCASTAILYCIDSSASPTPFRLFEWIFFNVHSEEASDDERAVYLNGLHEILSTDGGKSPHTAGMPVSAPL